MGEHQVAVILNGRARGVSPSVLRRLGRLVPRRDLFVSRTLGDAREIAAEVVERAYPSVLLGGGDGTFVACVTEMRSEARRRGTPLPSVGMLRLGTGNALARTLGASPPTAEGLARDLARANSPALGDAIDLLEVGGRLTPFAGVGLDAQILEDYAAMTRQLDALGVGQRLGAGARYALAVALRSVPRYLARPLPEVVAVNLGAPALRVGGDGRPIGPPIAAGQVLYRGPLAIAAGSTIPYYGLGIKIFPHAGRMPGRFHLRCARSSTLEILAHLPSLWRGRYESDTIFDFLVDRVELRLERPSAVQIGGDLEAEPRDRVVLALARRAVRVVA
jgi:diacylglycerol kinase family enzyme